MTHVAFGEGELIATVEDEDQEEQLDLRLGYDADGNLWSSCDCGAGSGICLHGLAALLAYGTAGDADSRIEDALGGGHRGTHQARLR